MSAVKLNPPKVEYAYVFEFANEECIELTEAQYKQMVDYFITILCPNCDQAKTREIATEE